MLSKMARPEVKYNYNHIEIAKKDLNKSKVVDLKTYAKTLEIKTSGNKEELKQRIQRHIKIMDSVIKIQSVMRRKLVYIWKRLKGDTRNCVNDTDFYTLEPIYEIPYMYHMQYTGHNVKYGFNIVSLCSLAVKNKNFENPYTREDMRQTIANEMGRIIKLTNALFPGNELMNQLKSMYEGKDSSSVLHGLFAPVQTNNRQRSNPVLTRLQSLPMAQRITELFMAIDNLGNYTQKEWLTRLSLTQLRYTIVKVYAVWQRLPLELRNQICPQISPCSRHIMANMTRDDLTQEYAIESVVKMAEVRIHSSTQREDRVMGAMYFLIGLSMASPDARLAMPWLHDSYYDIVNREM